MAAGFCLTTLGLLAWGVPFYLLKSTIWNPLLAPFPHESRKPTAYTFAVKNVGSYEIDLRFGQTTDHAISASKFLDWKNPPRIPCEIHLSVTNSSGSVLLEKECDSLAPAMWSKNWLYYSLGEFVVRSKGICTITIENRSALQLLDGVQPFVQVHFSPLLLKQRMYLEAIGQLIGFALAILGVFCIAVAVICRLRKRRGRSAI